MTIGRSPSNVGWGGFGGTPDQNRHSPLTLLDKSNVTQLGRIFSVDFRKTDSTIFRGSPPTTGIRNREYLPASRRVKRTWEPSGEKRGNPSSGPLVSATSSPPGYCLSQIVVRPSRVEAKAMRRPSGEAEGSKSRPE